jgi:Domain of unknown function (DUF4381)
VKGRNPKTDGRKKAEIRRPNVEIRCGCGTRLALVATAARLTDSANSLLGFRISAFFRPSVFGLRILTPPLCLLASALPLPAATSTAPDDIPRLRPPHAEIPPTFWVQYSLWVILFGVLLLALVCAAIWFLTRPKPPLIVPPDVQARQALEPLRQQPEDGALLSRVSQILRHYVAAAFNLPPGELTTTEFCRAVAAHPQIGLELAAVLSDFLRLCDQDKFAPPAPVPPLNAVAQALKLIDQSQARRLALAQPAAQPPQSAVATPPIIGIQK